MTEPSTADQVLLLTLCLLAAAWGLLGWLDLPDQAFAGFDTDGSNVVTRVYEGSPAEVAGLQTGDRISQFDGVALKDAATLDRLPRKKSGEVRRLTIERADGMRIIEVTYAATRPETVKRSHALLLVGFCYLCFPLLAWLRRPAEQTRLLVLMGFGLSLSFFGAPYIGDFGMRSLATAITSLFALFGLVALLQFLLMFPHQRPWLNRTWAKPLLYFPAFLLWLLLAYRVLFTPTATSALSTVTQFLSGVIIFGYLVFSLYLLLRNYSRTDRSERKKLGLNLMLFASVVGFLPVFVAQLVRVFSPNSPLPGQDYYFISLALLPMFWARSAIRLNQ
ncbi:MAG TPA: PDZ domain-containing protein [Xanthomonadales bacterium]|nr:PDZ domain-containing protein [Xanthomonadales bacterium]